MAIERARNVVLPQARDRYDRTEEQQFRAVAEREMQSVWGWVADSGKNVAGSFIDNGGAVLNVRHPRFGAVGDGITDDAAAIQAAVDVAATAGGTVFIPDGSYVVASTIILPDNVSLRGAGQNRVTLYWTGSTAGGACIQVGAAADGTSETTTNVHLSDFRIYIPDSATAGGIGIDVRSGKWSCSYERLSIGLNSLRAFDVGIRLRPLTFTNRINGCNIERCAVAIQMDSTANTNWVTQNTINNNTQGIVLDSLNNVVIRDNELEGNTEEAVDCNACQGIVLEGNRFERNFEGSGSGGAQIMLTNSWVVIRGNLFSAGSGDPPDYAVNCFNSTALIERNYETTAHNVYFVTANVLDGTDVEVRGNRLVAANAPNVVFDSMAAWGARVRHSTTQSIPDDTDTAVLFNTEDFDTGANAHNSTNTSRLTAKIAGKYKITAVIQFDTNGTGGRQATIRLNGTTAIAQDQRASSGAVRGTTCVVSTEYNLAANDYVEVLAWQNSGGALNVIGGQGSSFQFRRSGA